ncbi:MAG: histidine ammonia-lyase, partial [Desulfacinum sp.]|nr:histidine ammonia-lyase [Desulfacinum sp.]
MRQVVLGQDGMSLEELVVVAREGARVSLDDESWNRLERARALIDRWVQEERVIYGVTTGFGALSDVIISKEEARALQRNILMSHSAGVGPELPGDEVRALMALRLKDLARGHSGIRPETARRLLEVLNAGILPVVPEKGSVGASGDLAPLAHMSLVLIGMGEAMYQGERMSGAEALARAGLDPLELEACEGLALANGTQLMTAIGALALHDALRLSKAADIAASMSLEVLMGSRTEFDARIHQVRPHPGQAKAAENMRRITHDSDIISSHKDCSRVQDAYTLRCSPQVHGATKDALGYCRSVVETEMNSSTNNPLIFADDEQFLLGGNFHGQPVALAMDFMGMAVAELANISERRVERLV